MSDLYAYLFLKYILPINQSFNHFLISDIEREIPLNQVKVIFLWNIDYSPALFKEARLKSKPNRGTFLPTLQSNKQAAKRIKDDYVWLSRAEFQTRYEMQFQYSRVGYICLKRKDTFAFLELLLKSVSSVFRLKLQQKQHKISLTREFI